MDRVNRHRRNHGIIHVGFLLTPLTAANYTRSRRHTQRLNYPTNAPTTYVDVQARCRQHPCVFLARVYN